MKEAPERWSNAFKQAQHSLRLLQLAKVGAQESDGSGCNRCVAINQVWQQLAQRAEGHPLLGFRQVGLCDVVPEPAPA